MEPEQEGVRKRRRDDPVLFHIVLVPEAERLRRLWCTWWVWAGPRSTRETHNVSFVLNDCAVGTGLSLSFHCLLSPVKCGNDFCCWTSVRFFWEGWVLPSCLSLCPYLCFTIFQSFIWWDSVIPLNLLGVCNEGVVMWERMKWGDRHMQVLWSRE